METPHEKTQVDVERQMTSAGINVILKREGIKQAPGFPQLVIQIVGYSTFAKGDKAEGIAYFVQTELNQRILLARNLDINARAGMRAS